MVKIVNITNFKGSFYNYHFLLEEGDKYYDYLYRDLVEACPFCFKKATKATKGTHHVIMLDKTYLNIINSLKKAGLLEQDYEPICCNCYKELEKYKCR